MTKAEREKLARFAASLSVNASGESKSIDNLSREHTLVKNIFGGLIRAVNELKFGDDDLILAIELAFSDVEKLRKHHYHYDDVVFFNRNGIPSARWKEDGKKKSVS